LDVAKRNNVTLQGSGDRVMMFGHGFGCDQSMWRHVARRFADENRVVLFDNVGAGHSDLSAYSSEKYGTLNGYAADVIEICESLRLPKVVFVGHSVSATIGVLAAVKRPDLFSGLVLVCPSPRYANTDTYTGGFQSQDIAELLDLLDLNHLEWSANMAPMVIGPGSEDVQDEWRESVCRTDPAAAKEFARVTFLSDHRDDYRAVTTPTLTIECRIDSLAPREVGAWVHQAISGSRLTTLETSGHCPHMTDPAGVIDAVRTFLPSLDGLAAAA